MPAAETTTYRSRVENSKVDDRTHCTHVTIIDGCGRKWLTQYENVDDDSLIAIQKSSQEDNILTIIDNTLKELRSAVLLFICEKILFYYRRGVA